MENVETGVNVITLCFTKVSGILLFSRDPKKKSLCISAKASVDTGNAQSMSNRQPIDLHKQVNIVQFCLLTIWGANPPRQCRGWDVQHFSL